MPLLWIIDVPYPARPHYGGGSNARARERTRRGPIGAEAFPHPRADTHAAVRADPGRKGARHEVRVDFKATFAVTAIAVGCYATLAQDNDKDAKLRITAATPAGEVATRARPATCPSTPQSPSRRSRPACQGKARRHAAGSRPARGAVRPGDRPSKDAKMSRGKPVQEGVRVKLPAGVKAGTSWQPCRPSRSAQKNLFPMGFRPLPHANHPEGGMVFHKSHDRRGEEADRPRPDALRPRLRPPRAPRRRVPAGDLPDDPAGAGRRLAGQAGHDRQLLRAVQRHPEPQAARRPAAAGHAVPAAAVQRDRGPPQRAAEPGRELLRLPRERPHERRVPPRRRHPPAGVPPPHRDADAARRQRPAAVRLAARAARPSRTSPSSSSAPPTSTATR